MRRHENRVYNESLANNHEHRYFFCTCTYTQLYDRTNFSKCLTSPENVITIQMHINIIVLI